MFVMSSTQAILSRRCRLVSQSLTNATRRNSSHETRRFKTGFYYHGSCSIASAKGFHQSPPCRKRHLSSVPISSNSWWTDVTSNLLNRDCHPIGSFDTLMWQKGETMIQYWVEQGGHGLDLCFQILDRLAEEAARNPQFQMNIYLIHAILRNWNKSFQNFQNRIVPSQILAKLEGYLTTAPGLFAPNIATYTIILDGAASCPNPAERIVFSEELLARLLEESKHQPSLRPTDVTIGTVLKAWLKSGSLRAAQKAEALLRRIIQLVTHEDWNDLEVNTIHYTTVVNAYANAGDAESAERLLREMYEEYLVRGNSKVRPNVRSFNAVLVAWSKSSSPDAFASAEALFIKMEELHQSGALEEPRDVISYNCLLQALSKHENTVMDAVDKAEVLVNDLIQHSAMDPSNPSMKPTAVTITMLLRILAASNHPEKAEKATYWLQKAKTLGISDERFLLDQFQTKVFRKHRSDTARPAQSPNSGIHPTNSK